MSGAEQAVFNLTPFQVSAVVSLAPRSGIQEITLDERHVSRPSAIEVVSITPDRVSLDVDREIEKRLRVVPDPRGEPAAGAVEGEHTAMPEFVTVKGPQSSLESRDTIFAPVSIARARPQLRAVGHARHRRSAGPGGGIEHGARLGGRSSLRVWRQSGSEPPGDSAALTRESR